MADPLSPEIVLALSPDALRALLDAFGAPNAAGLTAERVARDLFEERAPARLARALPLLARLATESGKRAIVEAARAKRDGRAEGWLAMPAADLAATLVVERATARGRAKRAAERIVELALLRVDRELAERPTYELVADSPVARDDVGRSLARATGGGAHDAWTHVDREGALRVALFVRGPATARLALDRARVARRNDAPVTVDLVRVGSDGARVAITTATPELLPRYAKALGASLRPSFTLRPLHDLTADALARLALPRGVRGVAVVALRWRTPDGARVEIRAKDALAATLANGLARAGYVDRATIRVDLGERSVDAFLQLPHRVEIADRAHEAPVREALAAIGLFDPGALPDDARSLAPYEHADWRWRAVVGDDGFGALVRAGRLARVEVAHVATEELRMHGASYVVRAAGDAEYALAEDRAYGARLVDRGDRAAWRLDRDALAGAMRADLGAARAGRGGAIAIDGVIDLGLVALKSGKLRFVYAMGAPARGWLDAARRACGLGVTPVALVPRGHAGGLDGVLVVELDVAEQLGVKRIGRVLGIAAEALGVRDEVEPWRVHDEDVIVEAATGRVWVRGELVPLSDKPYRFLAYLAKSARVVTTKELGACVSASDYPDETARRVKGELEKQVGAALAKRVDGGGAEGLVVTEGKKGYRLGVTARVIEAGG